MSNFDIGISFFFLAVLTFTNCMFTTMTLKMYSEMFKEIAQQKRHQP